MNFIFFFYKICFVLYSQVQRVQHFDPNLSLKMQALNHKNAVFC